MEITRGKIVCTTRLLEGEFSAKLAHARGAIHVMLQTGGRPPSLSLLIDLQTIGSDDELAGFEEALLRAKNLRRWLRQLTSGGRSPKIAELEQAVRSVMS